MPLNRRAFLRDGTLTLVAANVTANSLFAVKQEEVLKVGLMTDMHYADKPTRGSRHYRETLGKLEEASDKFNDLNLSFVVELGDFIDAAPGVETELGYLKTVNSRFQKICQHRHYVLGNHCVDTLRKEEFLGVVEQKAAHYSFDAGEYHFIILDSCFRSDGVPYGRKNSKWNDANIPDDQLEWLQSDLKRTSRKTIIFVHQRLDNRPNYSVKNAPVVRKILEESGKVLAVFQGHSHKNELQEIGGIHYCTLVAMVEGAGTENNAYSVMNLFLTER
jgi:predicted phosphodiesterase